MSVSFLVTGVHSDGDVPRGRRGNGIHQQRESSVERRREQRRWLPAANPPRNRSEPRPERGHSRGAPRDGYPEIQVILLPSLPPSLLSSFYISSSLIPVVPSLSATLSHLRGSRNSIRLHSWRRSTPGHELIRMSNCFIGEMQLTDLPRSFCLLTFPLSRRLTHFHILHSSSSYLFSAVINILLQQ